MIRQLDVPIYDTNVLFLLEPTGEEWAHFCDNEINKEKLTEEEIKYVFGEIADKKIGGSTYRFDCGNYMVLIKIRRMNKKIAEISIDLYQRGLLARCEELEMEAMCSSGEELMDFLNEVQCYADPDVRFKLTEKGAAVAKALRENPELTYEEACSIADKVKMELARKLWGDDGEMLAIAKEVINENKNKDESESNQDR